MAPLSPGQALPALEHGVALCLASSPQPFFTLRVASSQALVMDLRSGGSCGWMLTPHSVHPVPEHPCAALPAVAIWDVLPAATTQCPKPSPGTVLSDLSLCNPGLQLFHGLPAPLSARPCHPPTPWHLSSVSTQTQHLF